MLGCSGPDRDAVSAEDYWQRSYATSWMSGDAEDDFFRLLATSVEVLDLGMC